MLTVQYLVISNISLHSLFPFAVTHCAFSLLLWLFSIQHDESIRRHMEQIEQRKEKAAELSSGRHANTDYAPKLTPYERKKQCSLCNVMVSWTEGILSELQGQPMPWSCKLWWEFCTSAVSLLCSCKVHLVLDSPFCKSGGLGTIRE